MKILKRSQYRILRFTESFPLELRRIEEQGDRELHSHEFTEMVVVYAGHGTHLTGCDSYRVGAGDVFIVPPLIPHGYRIAPGERFSLINVMFNFDELHLPHFDLRKSSGFRALFELEPESGAHGGNLLSSDRHLNLNPGSLEIVLTILSRLDSALNDRRAGYQFRSVGIFMELISFLADYFSAMPSEDQGHHRLMQLSRVLGFMERHYAENISIPGLARMAAMSGSNFYRTFTALMGRSAERYLAELRMSHAAALLCRTDLPITEVALRSGFSDSNYFSRMFRKYRGCSPREYRIAVSKTD